jgi:hypothetical protein
MYYVDEKVSSNFTFSVITALQSIADPLLSVLGKVGPTMVVEP